MSDSGYFGMKLGEAVSAGAGHISKALERKYDIQRQEELRRQQMEQMQAAQERNLSQQVRLSAAGQGIPIPQTPGMTGTDLIGQFAEAVKTQKFTKEELERNQRGEMLPLQQDKMRAETDLLRARVKSEGQIPTKPSVGQSAVDRTFAKEYSDYVLSGGYSDTASQLSALGGVLDQLKSATKGGDRITGPVIGRVPDFVRQGIAKESLPAQQKVEQSVQRTLKKTLGGQFTEKEGILFMQRGFDPRLDDAQNAEKLERMIGQLQMMADAKQSAMEYFEANGTMAGYKGTLYTLRNGEMLEISPQAPEARAMMGQPAGIPPQGGASTRQARIQEIKALLGR
jgi:hypothetical protein